MYWERIYHFFCDFDFDAYSQRVCFGIIICIFYATTLCVLDIKNNRREESIRESLAKNIDHLIFAVGVGAFGGGVTMLFYPLSFIIIAIAVALLFCQEKKESIRNINKKKL